MRILLINHEFMMSGAAVNLLKIADHLARSGHECAVFPGRPSSGPIEAEYVGRGIPILQKAEFPKFAAVLCNTIHAGSLVTMAAPYTRTIWWIREAESGLEYLLTRPTIAAAFRDASAVVVQHEHQRDNVYRSFLYPRDPATVFVVPNGFQIARVGPSAAKSRPIRVIAVGSVYGLKRQGDLIRAVEALRRPDIDCVFIGRRIELGEAEQSIAEAAPDRFRFLGEPPLEETLAWLRSSDICCLPSRMRQPRHAAEGSALGRVAGVARSRCSRSRASSARNARSRPASHAAPRPVGVGGGNGRAASAAGQICRARNFRQAISYQSGRLSSTASTVCARVARLGNRPAKSTRSAPTPGDFPPPIRRIQRPSGAL